MRPLTELIDDFKKDKLEQGLFTSTNEYGNNVIVEVFSDCLKISTLQNNGWTRINEYYKDGTTTESYTK